MPNAVKIPRKPKPVSKELILETASRFRFASWINDSRAFRWHGDDYDLDRIVRELSEKIMEAEPVLEAPKQSYVSAMRVTEDEGRWIQVYWRTLWLRTPAFEAITKDGWSTRRCQKEMVSMLRALIELDRHYLRQYDVTVIADIVHDFDRRELMFVDSEIFSELDRLPKGTKEGQLLRWGIFLGLQIHRSMADGRTDVDLDPEGLYDKLVGELGADDPMERLKREIDPAELSLLRGGAGNTDDAAVKTEPTPDTEVSR